MSWIALRDRQAGTFNPIGLGEPLSANVAPRDPDCFLPCGTLRLEFSFDPDLGRRNLLRYVARDPWLSSLILCLDPDGTLSLLQGQAERSEYLSLQIGDRMPGETVHVTFAWNAPMKVGVLAVDLPDEDRTLLAEIPNPIPLCYRDVALIAGSSATATLQPEVKFVAIADTVEPVGPGATIGPGAVVETADGPVPIGKVRLGQVIKTADGGEAQARWIGSQSLPARGQFAPLTMRHPYFGLDYDLLVSSDQRILLKGSKVEYLFGEEQICTAVRHLADGKAILRSPDRLVQTYYQLVLDRHAIIPVSGAMVESFDPSRLTRDPGLLPHSILRNMPRELLPRGPSLGIAVLRDYEALTLAR
ncbi:hypothetical protein EU803_10600 [Loktanella sp. IMCC34160]|uniref:Hint domain-containing protein n=1 Tax=Loktanella sp. IMCC34160 TaxID=2510646 RepID=UPI00101BE686|nr:Hint domain-containing protein [Loktanella sp. IMCC34160]RYG91529.1 hypothetical protein EU803_10600 [Loktanella sp. IMCC34160]